MSCYAYTRKERRERGHTKRRVRMGMMMMVIAKVDVFGILAVSILIPLRM